MAMYRTIETSIWTDPKIKQLTGDSKLLFVYLITNSHSHVSGIYYIPKSLMYHETSISNGKIDTLLDTLSGVELAYFDNENEVVWVRNMFRYQGKGEKNQRSAAIQLSNLHNSLLIKEYLKEYPEVKKHCSDTVLDRVSEVGIQEQEQEQYPGTGKGTEEESLTEYEQKIVTYFSSKIKNSVMIAWQEAHPTIIVASELLKAKAWLFANQHKRKVRFGSFLNNWMNSAANPPPWMKEGIGESGFDEAKIRKQTDQETIKRRKEQEDQEKEALPPEHVSGAIKGVIKDLKKRKEPNGN